MKKAFLITSLLLLSVQLVACGKEAAKEMKEMDMCLEEYLAYLSE